MTDERRRSPALSDPTYDQSFPPLTDLELEAALAVERDFRPVDGAERGQLLNASAASYLANFDTSHSQLYLPEQIGGGRGRARSASPSHLTPTKFRPKINASERGQRLIPLMARAEAHRAQMESLPSEHPPSLSDSTIQSSSTDSTLSASNASFGYDMPYGMASHPGQFEDAYTGNPEDDLANQAYFHPSANPGRYNSMDGGFRQQHQSLHNFPDNTPYLRQDGMLSHHPHPERRRPLYPDHASYPHPVDATYDHVQERRRSPYPTQSVTEPLPKAPPAQHPSGPGAQKFGTGKLQLPPGPDPQTVLERAGFQDIILPPGPPTKAPAKSNDAGPPDGPKIDVLPPTPAAPVPAQCNDVFSAGPASTAPENAFAMSSNPDIVNLGDSPTVGRLSQEKQSAVQNCFSQVDDIFRKTSEATGLSLTQLFNRYQHTLSGTRSSNRWNTYQGYIRDFLEQELGRLPPASRPDASEKLSRATISAAYVEFQKAHPDSGDKALSLWKQSHDLMASQQTVADRVKTFHSFFDNLETTVERARSRYGFDFLLMGAGSVVNQDQGLARMYCTEFLEDFFYDRLNIADDTLIAHASTHIFDKVSRATIADSNTEIKPSPSINADKTKPSNSTRQPASLAPSAAKAGSPAPSTLSKQGEQAADVITLRDKFEALAAKADTTFYQEGGKFQYKKMEKILENQRFHFVNWPESVPMAAKDKTTKGVGGVPAPLRAVLLKAFANARRPLDVEPIPQKQRQADKKADTKTQAATSTSQAKGKKKHVALSEESSSSEDDAPLSKKKAAGKQLAAKRSIPSEDEGSPPAKRRKSPKSKKKGRRVRKKVEDVDDEAEDDLFLPDTDDEAEDAEDPTASPGLTVPPRRTRRQGEPSQGMEEMYAMAAARMEEKHGIQSAKNDVKVDKKTQKTTEIKSSEPVSTKRSFGEVAEWPDSTSTKNTKVANELFPEDDKSDPSLVVKRQRQAEGVQQPPTGQPRMQVAPPPSSDGMVAHHDAYPHPDRYYPAGGPRRPYYPPDAYADEEFYGFNYHHGYYPSNHPGQQDGDHHPAYARHPGEHWPGIRQRPHPRGRPNQFSYGPPPEQASSSSSSRPSGHAGESNNPPSSSAASDER